MRTKILVVDDDMVLARSLAELLRGEGHLVTVAFSAEEAMACIGEDSFHLLITDLHLPGKSGIALIQRLREVCPDTRSVLITGQGSIRSAVTALKRGASEYLLKPVRPRRLLAVAQRLLADAPEFLPRAIGEPPADGVILGGLQTRSPAMHPLFDRVRVAATGRTPVLLIGECGVGKERTARAIHSLSAAAAGPFVRMLPDRLTGLETGTAFIEDVATLDEAQQLALLRVLAALRKDQRLGADGAPQPPRVRLMFSASQELAPLVAAGRFRQDLLDLMGGIVLRVPTLRERREDIPLLAAALVRELSEQLDRPAPVLPAETHRLLAAYTWPGNMRELRSVLERALGALRGPTLEPALLPPELRGQTAAPASFQITIGTSMDVIEREVILRTLEANQGNKTVTAEVLGISRRSIYNKLALYGTDKPLGPYETEGAEGEEDPDRVCKR